MEKERNYGTNWIWRFELRWQRLYSTNFRFLVSLSFESVSKSTLARGMGEPQCLIWNAIHRKMRINLDANEVCSIEHSANCGIDFWHTFETTKWNDFYLLLHFFAESFTFSNGRTRLFFPIGKYCLSIGLEYTLLVIKHKGVESRTICFRWRKNQSVSFYF